MEMWCVIHLLVIANWNFRAVRCEVFYVVLFMSLRTRSELGILDTLED